MKKEPMETTIALIKRDLEYIKTEVSEIRLEQKSGTVSKEEFIAYKQKVNKLENNQAWVVRIILGSVITGLMAIVYSFKGGQ